MLLDLPAPHSPETRGKKHDKNREAREEVRGGEPIFPLSTIKIHELPVS